MPSDDNLNPNSNKSRPPLRLFITGWSVVFLSYFAVGYQNAVLNASTDVFLEFINSSYIKHGYSKELTISGTYTLYSIIVSLWQVGCIFGSLLSCMIEERFGRKRALLFVATSVQMLGSFLMVLAPILDTFELLAIGRFIAGLSSGIVCPTLRVYLCECCPNAYRGYLNGPGGFVLSISSLIALAFGQPSIFGTRERAPYLLGVCIVPSIIQLLINPCIPPSPKYLYIEKGDAAGAVKALFFYHGQDANVAKLFREYEMEKRLASEQLTFRRALFTKSVRTPLILCTIIALAHSSTGIDIVEAYSTEIFSKLGMQIRAAQLYSIIINIPGLIGGILAIFIADRCGRRPLLFSTMGVSILYNLLFVVLCLTSRSYGYRWSLGASAVALTGAQTFFYSLGPGAIAESLFAEISPQNVRAVMGSLSEFIYWLSNSIYVFAFPPILVSFGPYAFLLYTLPLLICILYLIYALPETRGRSVVDIVEDLNEGNDENNRGQLFATVDSAADFLPIIGRSTSSASTDLLGSRSISTGPVMT